MEWVETTGRTIEAAREAALDQLGVDERDAELVVVAEPRSGLFGFGRVEARVRARVRPAPPRPKRTSRRRGDDRGRGRTERGGKSAEPFGGGRPPERASGHRGRGQAPAGERQGEDAGERRDGEGPATSLVASSSDGRAGPGWQEAGVPPSRRQDGGRDGRRRGEEEGGLAAGPPKAGVEEVEMTIEEQASAVERFVAGVVQQFGFDQAETTVQVDGDRLLVDVTGDDLGLLVGPRGRTLDALQELARTVIQRRGEEGGTRVVVDVAGFRAKRTAALESFTRRITQEVLERGEAQALEAMSAADRKVVHDTVTVIEGVHTSSEGTEPNRYVVIHPTTSRADGREDLKVAEAEVAEVADDA